MPVLLKVPDRSSNKSIGGFSFLRPGHIGLEASFHPLIAQVASSLIPVSYRSVKSKHALSFESSYCGWHEATCLNISEILVLQLS